MDIYKELLDLTFELEGLVRLRMERDKDEALDELINNKAQAISALAGNGCQTVVKAAAQAPEMTEDDGGEDDMFYAIPDETDERAREEDGIPDPAAAKDAQSSPVPERAKPLLSVNDRFRFRRELFSNSDRDFNSALDLVATMDSYDEAEDYFYNELEWDPENEVVVEFMTLLTRYFKN